MKIKSNLKADDEKLNVPEAKAALDDLVQMAYSMPKDVIGEDGMSKMMELQSLSTELNSLLTFEVLASEIKNMISSALAEDQPMGQIKRNGDIMS